MKKDAARDVAAEILNIAPEDMLPIIGGKLQIHAELGGVHLPVGVVD